jgi:uncharacterized protein YbaR (Trm112 family)
MLSTRSEVACPSCGQPMARQDFERQYRAAVPIDICHGCGAFWFDAWEDLTLTPGAVLRLFVVMNDSKPPAQRHPLGSNLCCPKCRARLVLTRDVQRATRFEYWRCPAEHGRFITFFQFLRQKNFIRPLSVAEMDRLRQNVRSVTCSSCGAPVDLNAGSACPHCKAPLSMLDARQVDTVVQQLKREEAHQKSVDAELPLRLLQDRLSVEDRFARLDAAPLSVDLPGLGGLVEAGVATLVALLTERG